MQESSDGGTGAADVGVAIDTLGRYLEERVPGFGGLRSVGKFAGGQSNPTFRLDAATGTYVLRRKPPGRLLPSAHAIDREYRVLGALAATAVPVPKVLHYCADEAVLGSPFYVMEHVCGSVHWDGRLPGLEPTLRRRIYAEMNRVLAALHEVVPADVGLADYGRPGGYYERQVRRWTEQYRAAETDVRPAMELLIDWLPGHLPSDDGQVAITHGDFRLDNFVFTPEGRAAALLDWELSTLGHPYADLAYQCAQWRLPPGTLRGLGGVDRAALGLPTEAEYVAAYREARRLQPIDGWPFYLAVSLFRLASICQGVYRRGLDGNASSPDAPDFGRRVDVIAGTAVDLIR
ncbi:MAG: phosphotransferase family protein [Steroidobacteraceae bacterium]|jgi:aminoglycoside phosphotransferase (APT) family kinase protein|nr:phosphotransferase family protein [Steroidobacteraceae bacterium]